MPTAWERHFVRNEFLLTTAGVLILAAWATWLGGETAIQSMLTDNRAAFYGAVASIAGALLGFLITTVALLQGIVAAEGFRRLRASDQYPTLWRVFHLAIRVLALACAVSLIALLVDRDAAPVPILFYVVVWAIIESGMLVGRGILGAREGSQHRLGHGLGLRRSLQWMGRCEPGVIPIRRKLGVAVMSFSSRPSRSKMVTIARLCRTSARTRGCLP